MEKRLAKKGLKFHIIGTPVGLAADQAGAAFRDAAECSFVLDGEAATKLAKSRSHFIRTELAQPFDSTVATLVS